MSSCPCASSAGAFPLFYSASFPVMPIHGGAHRLGLATSGMRVRRWGELGGPLLSPKNLLSWPISGGARAQSACRRTLATDASLAASHVGRACRLDLGQAVFWRGKQATSPLPKPRFGVSSAAARWRLAAVACGAFRAICVPRRPWAGRRQGAPLRARTSPRPALAIRRRFAFTVALRP